MSKQDEFNIKNGTPYVIANLDAHTYMGVFTKNENSDRKLVININPADGKTILGVNYCEKLNQLEIKVTDGKITKGFEKNIGDLVFNSTKIVIVNFDSVEEFKANNQDCFKLSDIHPLTKGGSTAND